MTEPTTNGAFWITSPTTDKIMPDLVTAIGQLPTITKDQTAKIPTKDGGSYTYSFADLAGVLTAVRPILAKHNLAIIQAASTLDSHGVLVCTTIFHTSGEWIKFDPLAMAGGGTAQAIGSAITYARRYALMACLALAAEDDDGAAATAQAQSRESEQRSRQSDQRDSTRKPAASPAEPVAPAEPRSKDEQFIRQLIAGLPAAFINDVRKAFKVKFGMVGELDLDRHGEALTWTMEVVAEIEARLAGGGDLLEIIKEIERKGQPPSPTDLVAAIENFASDTPTVTMAEVAALYEATTNSPEPPPPTPLRLVPHTTPTDEPPVELASKTQLVALKVLFRGKKVNANDQLAVASELAKRPITDLAQLTAVECAGLIKTL